MIKVSLDNDLQADAVEGIITYLDDGNTVLLPKVSAKSLTHNLSKSADLTSGILPPAVRWISGQGDMFVFERPPRMQTLSYYPVEADMIDSNTKLCTYNIPIPWTVYVVVVSATMVPTEIRVFARNSPLESLSDLVYLLPIPNLYYSGALCAPIFEKFEAQEPTLAAAAQAAYNMVWNSGFNFDLIDAIKASLGQHVPFYIVRKSRNSFSKTANFFQRWSECSIEDALSLKWPRPSISDRGSNPYDLSLDTILEQMRSVRRLRTTSTGHSFMVHLINTISSLG